LLGKATLQLLSRQLDALVVGHELEAKAIAVNGDSQPGRTGGESKQGAQFWLSELEQPPLQPQMYAPAPVGDQSRR
jgi:hypothetical protein